MDVTVDVDVDVDVNVDPRVCTSPAGNSAE
jgi:hypothetical protein